MTQRLRSLLRRTDWQSVPPKDTSATIPPSTASRCRTDCQSVPPADTAVAPRRSWRLRLLFAMSLLALPACYQKMATQPSPRPLASSDFFPDGRASRAPVAGTVARGQLRADRPLYEGTDKDGKPVAEFPFEVSESVLKRGKQRYEVFCSVCHGYTGQGDGRIVQRGFTKPPSLTKDDSRGYALKKEKIKLTDVPVGYVYVVITKGHGAMPDYAEQIPPKDRWAIVGYVKALQYSQVPELREKLKKGDKK
jgi:mono/diheme cytochrome c family protein